MNNSENADRSGIKVMKSNGELVEFQPWKLVRALMNSGASESEAAEIKDFVVSRIENGMRTSKIYKLAYKLLRKKSVNVAGRYRLKKAVFDLGPSGYPFEKFIAKLLEFQGYNVDVNVIGQGRCVSHELDVVADKGDERIMVECKFHRDKGRKNDVKIPLYIRSRFIDMQEAWSAVDKNKKYVGMIATNTRFSEDAVDYARCVGLRLVSWDYPEGNALKDWIDRSGFHPVTSLHSLSKREKQIIMEEGVVLCRELVERPEVLEKAGVDSRKIAKVKAEAKAIAGD